MYLTKRGVSPLIATILLIAFAVALGSVILNWGLGSSSSACGQVRINFIEENDAQVCYGGAGQKGHIQFGLENKGKSSITGLSIEMVGLNGVQTHSLNNVNIQKSRSFFQENADVAYDFATNGKLSHVNIVPVIKGEEGIESCRDRGIKAELIKLCESI